MTWCRQKRHNSTHGRGLLLQNTVDYINTELDESEREEFFRLKKVQDKKKKAKALKEAEEAEAAAAAGQAGMVKIIWGTK